MKKFFLFILTIFLAYLTAFYVTGKKNGYEDPFDFKTVFNLNDSTSVSEKLSDTEKGLKELETGNYEEALKFFFDARSEENTSEINYYIGRTYLLQGNNKDALSYFETASELNPENAKAWLGKGIVKYNQSDYQNAINDLYFSTELSQEEAKAYYYLALSYSAQGKKEVALQSAETAVQYDSTDADSWYEAANLAYDNEDYRKSIGYYKKVLEILPKDKYSELNLGLSYSKSGDDDSAMIWYDKVISDYPDYSLAYNNKGYLYQKKEDYNKAVTLYTKALEFDPENTYALWNRADSYYIQKEFEKAIKDYEEIYKIEPQYYNSLYYKGLCFKNLDKKSDAVNAFNDFLDVADTGNKLYSEARNKLKKLQ